MLYEIHTKKLARNNVKNHNDNENRTLETDNIENRNIINLNQKNGMFTILENSQILENTSENTSEARKLNLNNLSNINLENEEIKLLHSNRNIKNRHIMEEQELFQKSMISKSASDRPKLELEKSKDTIGKNTCVSKPLINKYL